MKKIISILLLGVLLCGMIPGASASEEDLIEPCFQKIISTYADLYIDKATSTAYCYASCVAEKTTTVKITGTLQQHTNGSWVHVTSWTTTGVGTAVLDKQYKVASGYKYRFIARFYIYDSNGSFVESDILSRIYDYNS